MVFSVFSAMENRNGQINGASPHPKLEPAMGSKAANFSGQVKLPVLTPGRGVVCGDAMDKYFEDHPEAKACEMCDEMG